MNIPELNTLHILHVFSVIVLIAYTFYAFAAPPETRKRVLMITGIASLLVLGTGVRMWQGLYSFHFFAWVVVKLGCWLVLSGVCGAAYRKREKTTTLMIATLAFTLIALAAVFFRTG
jgi:hypothetical protein